MITLFKMQNKLDNLIVHKFSKRVGREIKHSQLIDKRLVALSAELGEFIKENDHNKKKSEWVDILHFLLSCGLALEIHEGVSKYDINTLYAHCGGKNYTDSILNFMVKFSDFENSVRSFKYWSIDRKPRPNVGKHYYKCFLALFDIAKAMGYTVQDIINAYETKNAENYLRQETEY